MNLQRRQEAFLAAIGPHEGMLRRLAAVHAESAEARRDLLQEMLLQLWRSFPEFRWDARFSTWMYRVALNTALLGWRRRLRRPEGHLSGDETALERLAEPAEDGEAVRTLYAAVRQLPGIDRAIVTLWLEGRSYEEIAEVTGLGSSNVGVRLVRLKQRLRTALEGVAAPSEARA